MGTLLVNTLDEEDTSTALLNASQRRVDAAVLIGSRFSDQVLATALGARRVRKLIVFARYSENPNTISICCDDALAMGTIAQYVIDQRYRRPLFLAGPQTQSAHLMRKETFVNDWRSRTGHAPQVITVPAYDPTLAREAVANVLRDLPVEQRPDILVCENDALAMGAVDAIRHDFGVRVPKDIAVTGFDDVPQALNPHYLLTTYRQPLEEMAEGLVAVLKGETEGKSLDRFQGTLIQRDSA